MTDDLRNLQPEAKDLPRLLATIEQVIGIRCGNYKEEYIKRRIHSRMNATKRETYGAYRQYLSANRDEIELLRNALTINVTRFMRDPEVFHVVKKEILPSILNRKKRIRIWSAGCSSGEEPYTYAMLLHEAMLLKKDLDVLVYATDIDDVILNRARTGIYERSALENLSDSQIRRHFIARDSGSFEIKPHLRELVRFQHHDLMCGSSTYRFIDIVSCRNVTIYFTEKQKNDLTRMFHESLVNDGYYVIGMSEYIGKEVENLFSSYRPMERIFQKA